MSPARTLEDSNCEIGENRRTVPVRGLSLEEAMSEPAILG